MNADIGSVLREYREKENISVKQVSNFLTSKGFRASEKTIYSWEKGGDPTLGFTYSNISAIQPLATQGMRYLFNCPEEIDQTDYPLFIEIQPAGTTDIYKFIIR